MLTDQHVIELVQRTDPVPDIEHLPGPRRDALTLLAVAETEPHLIPMTEDQDELHMVERSRTMDTQQHPEIRDSRRPRRWRTGVIAFAMVIVLVGAGVGIAALIANDDDRLVAADAVPTISFDGTVATYSGPSTFETGTITFRLENNSDEQVTFGWNVINDDSITMEEEIAWMETHRGSDYEIPPWVEDYGLITSFVEPGAFWEGSVDRPDGKGLLWAWDPFNRILHPAAHITVNSG